MGLLENMRNEPVSQLSLREPATAPPDATIRQAIERMREKKLGCVIVVDDDRSASAMLDAVDQDLWIHRKRAIARV